jgi:hypothetical protein
MAGAAARAAEIASRTQVYEAFVNAGGATAFRLLGVQALVGDGTVYIIGSHNAAAKTNTSQLLGPLRSWVVYRTRRRTP